MNAEPPNNSEKYADSELEHLTEDVREIPDASIFFNLSNDLLAIADTRGYFRKLNPMWEKVMGYSIEEMVSQPFFNFVHPDDLERTLTINNSNVGGAEVVNFENRYIARNGSVVWLLWTASLSKETQLIYAVAHDITNRKKTESELMQLTNALQNAVEGIAKIDELGEITSVNKSFAQQLGYESDELIGVHWQNIVAPASLETLIQSYEQMRANGKCTFDAIGLRKDGQTFFNELTIVTANKDDYTFGGHHCFMKDVSERKQAQIHLQESEARFSNLAKHLPGIIYQFLLRNDGSFQFPYISESCKTITEYEPADLQQNPLLVFEMIEPGDLATVRKEVFRSARSLSVWQFEGRLITKLGKTKWIQASSTPEVLDTGDVLWSCLLMDISDLKMAQERIKELNDDLEHRLEVLGEVNTELESLTRKLETAYDQALEASRLKSEFVANISHEVRTPISAVIGMSDLLLDTKLNSEQREFARIVRDSAESLLTIINDILDFSKMEAGKIELEMIDFSLSALIESCAEIMASNARERNLALVTYISPRIPQIMRGDPMRLRQIVLNLISNAVKFTEKGEVLILAELEKLEEAQATVCFSVKDTGIGMTTEARKLLFQPFVQADGSTTRKYGGTGLGLSISKRLVEMMAGQFEVDSAPGMGSTFTFKARFSIKDSNSETILSGMPQDELTSKRVLIATNNFSTSLSIQKYLNAVPIETTIAQDLPAAIGLLDKAIENKTVFDLLICGLSDSENDDDLTLMQKKQQSDDLSTMKTLRLISFDQKEKNETALKQGFSAYLSKPVRQTQLYSHVCDLLLSTRESKYHSSPDNLIETMKLSIEPIFKAPLDLNYRARTIDSRMLSSSLHGEVPGGAIFAGTSSNGVRILLAEDNVVIQKMAVKQLQKLGYEVDVVSNGREVLQAVTNKNYSIVLMDCQMPDIDGFAATRAIRSLETNNDRHLPIIAITASAMQGDRESCFAAGMDDYLSKPVDQNKLQAILEKWCMKKPDDEFCPTPSPNENQADEKRKDVDIHFDLARLSELYGEDGVRELLQSFLSEAESLLKTIEDARHSRNEKEFLAQVHQLKGLAAVMTFQQLEIICRQLEKDARRSAWDAIEPGVEQLIASYDIVKKLINQALA
ncbi:MAG: PAS domain S-box protein [Candidatus Obscuribacterales bacterium]|nr:PAS domain S-box protein [Candidatus Obscuribacterales bacterium]